LTLIARQTPAPQYARGPAIASAYFLRTLDQLDEINRNLQKALYGDDDVSAN